ncbi:MAG: DNA-3-methyladenine glycosylase 2 family protein [Ginsengibacter sp.]
MIKKYPPGKLVKKNKIYLQLCNSILSQQLSTHVARILQERFLNIYDGQEPNLTQILNTPTETFREIGFSNAKASYVHHVCRFFTGNKLTDARLHRMDNEDIIELLTQIKGVGRWTVEMLLIFSMQREDVFAFDDLGLRQGVINLYHLKETDKKLLRQKIEKIALKWSPYRSYASLYLWHLANER